MTPTEVRALLARHGLAAHRDRGQNFLADEALAAKLVRQAGVAPGDRVVEIGTGLGVLTRALVARGARVATIEIDAGLVRALRAEALLPEGVELHHADALDVDLGALLTGDATARVVANLPYAAATPLLRRLLDLRDRLASWSVMVQREVAQRMAAHCGDAGYGSLAALHQVAVRVERHGDVHARCFVPIPAVTSTFVTCTPHADGPDAAALTALEGLLRAAFTHRRKTLPGALRAARHPAAADAERLAAALAALGLDPRARPETLDPSTWLALAGRLET